jgi:hypothetical protein
MVGEVSGGGECSCKVEWQPNQLLAARVGAQRPAPVTNMKIVLNQIFVTCLLELCSFRTVMLSPARHCDVMQPATLPSRMRRPHAHDLMLPSGFHRLCAAGGSYTIGGTLESGCSTSRWMHAMAPLRSYFTRGLWASQLSVKTSRRLRYRLGHAPTPTMPFTDEAGIAVASPSQPESYLPGWSHTAVPLVVGTGRGPCSPSDLTRASPQSHPIGLHQGLCHAYFAKSRRQLCSVLFCSEFLQSDGPGLGPGAWRVGAARMTAFNDTQSTEVDGKLRRTRIRSDWFGRLDLGIGDRDPDAKAGRTEATRWHSGAGRHQVPEMGSQPEASQPAMTCIVCSLQAFTHSATRRALSL